MSALQPLLPGLATQFLISWAMVALFAPAKNPVHPLKPLGTAFLMLLLTLGIEVFLRPFLFQGTVVLQWALFVLLAHWICAIPLAKSMMAQFCFFSLMLGQGLLQERVPDAEVGQEERALLEGPDALPAPEAEATPDWVAHIEDALISNRLLKIRGDVHALIHGQPEPPPPPVEPTATPTPLPQPAEPTPIPVENLEGPTMTGAEFEALIYSSLPEPVVLPETPEEPPPPEPESLTDLFPTEEPGPFEVLGDPNTLTPELTGEIIEVHNRSTDPEYAAPTFEIGAISLGQNGRFAMVDGSLMREGAILRTSGSDPRGWKLFKVTSNELFWQPLK